MLGHAQLDSIQTQRAATSGREDGGLGLATKLAHPGSEHDRCVLTERRAALLPALALAADMCPGPQSLATAVQHQIGVVSIVFNNNQYGNVQQMQRGLYGGRVIATDLINPDFVKMAESYGAQGLKADSPEQLKTAIEQGFRHNGPTLIEVPLGQVESIDKLRKLSRIR